MSELNIEGLDEFLSDVPVVVQGITPEQNRRPAFTLHPAPPRKRVRTIMEPQMDTKDGKEIVLGFKPKQIEEIVEGGYMLRAMKGHSIFIDNLSQLADYKLSAYVKMVDNSDPDDLRPSTVPLAAVVEKRSSRNATT